MKPIRGALRTGITAAYRRAEPDCLPPLLDAARLHPPQRAAAEALATRLITTLRAKGTRGPVDGLVREYSLSSQEGVALMCLAEALLRIPDRATRDALVRDKVGGGDWRAHAGHSPSLFVNAATWGLVVTGKLTATADETGLALALSKLVARGGEPLIRRGVDLAMRMMGEQFVTGQTIQEALTRSRKLEARGFRYSYDMLGEAATTAEDAARYLRDYEAAIHAIGQAAGARGIVLGPGISVKLSALHPRYTRSQRQRVMTELLPRLQSLAVLARRYDIGLNIDAEEADRLDLSLDLLEALCIDPALAGWNGVGFVVQAYGKRAFAVTQWLIELGRRTGRRLMVRLVKGAYWDSEIKRAQVDGLADYPVFTRKAHTDVSYLACARLMLEAPDAVFPQFASHNAYTVAAIHTMAGPAFTPEQYEFQCLHGMGEPLFDEVVGANKLNRPCRIYAPVGTHETLLAYLVRRLLENGANSSFVNRIQDPAIPVAELAADPVALVAASEPLGAPHPAIPLPSAVFGPARANSAGLDLSSEAVLADLEPALAARRTWRAGGEGEAAAVRNPADAGDLVGHVVAADAAAVERALAQAEAAAPGWAATPPAGRADRLRQAAALMQAALPSLLPLLVREAGRSIPNAVAEVREAVDFLRYYAAECERAGAGLPLGPVACISPWNFPLAIFTGQVAAALAAGNPVLAKPAEQTPLIAAQAVALLQQGGIPPEVLQLLPGAGSVGAQLAADPRVCGVLFTGSLAVARHIQQALATRLGPDGAPIPLVAETGGQNAMVVDSSALAEQVVADVLVSAFDSAGQRCSALRLLCLQDEVADRILHMLRGAMAELVVGDPVRLATDVSPVISAAARETILAHVAASGAAGHAVHSPALPPDCARGTFLAPTLIELSGLQDLKEEVFGPVLHVIRFQRDGLDALMAGINALGYGLTFGLHTRLDETIARVTAQSGAGNLYVNRTMIGAVVGVQPFGGHGLSGTGPKAGGPLYLARLTRRGAGPLPPGQAPEAARRWEAWLRAAGQTGAALHCAACIAATPLGLERELPGPVGERNLYTTLPRGAVRCVADTRPGLFAQISAALATGNRALVPADRLPAPLDGWVAAFSGSEPFDLVLYDGAEPGLRTLLAELAERPGPVVPCLVREGGVTDYNLDRLVRERTISTNVAAAGGNASLMMLGEPR